MAFKTKDIITKNSKVLFRRQKLPNPGIKMTYWKLIDRQTDSKGQQLILFINQELAKILKRMNLADYASVDKGLLKILSDSFGRKAGTTLTADHDEGPREPMVVQASKPDQSTVDDRTSVSSHMEGKFAFYVPMMDIIKVVQINSRIAPSRMLPLWNCQRWCVALGGQ